MAGKRHPQYHHRLGDSPLTIANALEATNETRKEDNDRRCLHMWLSVSFKTLIIAAVANEPAPSVIVVSLGRLITIIQAGPGLQEDLTCKHRFFESKVTWWHCLTNTSPRREHRHPRLLARVRDSHFGRLRLPAQYLLLCATRLPRRSYVSHPDHPLDFRGSTPRLELARYGSKPPSHRPLGRGSLRYGYFRIGLDTEDCVYGAGRRVSCGGCKDLTIRLRVHRCAGEDFGIPDPC